MSRKRQRNPYNDYSRDRELVEFWRQHFGNEKGGVGQATNPRPGTSLGDNDHTQNVVIAQEVSPIGGLTVSASGLKAEQIAGNAATAPRTLGALICRP